MLQVALWSGEQKRGRASTGEVEVLLVSNGGERLERAAAPGDRDR